MNKQTLTMILYILVMALVTYLVRAVPFVAFRKKIKSRFIRSMLCTGQPRLQSRTDLERYR